MRAVLTRNARCEGKVKRMRNWQNKLGRLRLMGAANRVGIGQREPRTLRGEEGANLVEMALASAVLFAMLFGVFEMTLAFYSYHFVAEAAREATRWAIVRGSESCTNTPNLQNCNASGSDIQTYVQTLGYPGINSGALTATTTFLCGGIPTSTGATWSTGGCSSGAPNAPGNQVQVTVTYPFPLSIPFWQSTTLNVSSTSTMVIAQ